MIRKNTEMKLVADSLLGNNSKKTFVRRHLYDAMPAYMSDFMDDVFSCLKEIDTDNSIIVLQASRLAERMLQLRKDCALKEQLVSQGVW